MSYSQLLLLGSRFTLYSSYCVHVSYSRNRLLVLFSSSRASMHSGPRRFHVELNPPFRLLRSEILAIAYRSPPMHVLEKQPHVFIAIIKINSICCLFLMALFGCIASCVTASVVLILSSSSLRLLSSTISIILIIACTPPPHRKAELSRI